MKILLIRGSENKKAIDLSHYTFSEPIGLQILAKFFEKNHEVEIFDMMVEKISIETKLLTNDYDLCGISSVCNDIFIIKMLAKRIKKIKNIPIFVGGYQVKKTPEFFKSRNIDYIVVETNSKNLTLMLDEIKNEKTNKISGIYKKNEEVVGTKLLFSDEEMEAEKKYTEKYKKEYSYFIYKPSVLLDFYKEKNLMNTIKKIEEKNITFIDMNFFQEKNEVLEFFNKIANSGIKKKFLVYGSKKSLKEMESNLEFLNKNGLDSIILFLKEEKAEDLLLIEKIRKAKIKVWVYFNLQPEYDKNDFRNLRSYIKKLKASVVTLYPQNPFYEMDFQKKYEKSLIYTNELRANRYPGYILIKPYKISLKEYYIEILKTSLYSYRWSFIKFPVEYGLKNSFRFFWKSFLLFVKFVKIIYKS